ncbi:MAG: hypothetical protein ACRD0K_00355 [Egibacteraceae bacterium]
MRLLFPPKAGGFIGIPAEVIVALRAADGGDLRWLGSSEHATRDFMHFELLKRPPPH